MKDLINFENQCLKTQQSKLKDKKTLKSQLCFAMKNLEDRRENERKNEALLHAQQKDGPPMMIAMDCNEKKFQE